MDILKNKIDFMVTLEVKSANPNGDPLNGNMPRNDVDGYGEISDVCIKRKIRNRMQDLGQNIFVQSNDRIDDEFKSLEKRFTNKFGKEKNEKHIYDECCKNWMDIRAFGQVITYNKLSIGIRGPISISLAKSLSPIVIQSMQITKSTNGMEAAVGKERSSDTMGSKHFIEYGVYLVKGSINCLFSEKTGFTNSDSEVFKECLRTLFENDSSSARPDGSMRVKEIFWFKHASKTGTISSASVFDSLMYDNSGEYIKQYEDYNIRIDEQKLNDMKSKGVEFELIKGF